jgi:hypothetical protein
MKVLLLSQFLHAAGKNTINPSGAYVELDANELLYNAHGLYLPV